MDKEPWLKSRQKNVINIGKIKFCKRGGEGRMSEQDKTTMSAEEVLQKFDKESDKRNLTGMWDKLISFICIAFAVFQLYTATFGVLDAH